MRRITLTSETETRILQTSFCRSSTRCVDRIRIRFSKRAAIRHTRCGRIDRRRSTVQLAFIIALIIARRCQRRLSLSYVRTYHLAARRISTRTKIADEISIREARTRGVTSAVRATTAARTIVTA